MSEANKILLRLKLRFDIYRNWHKYQEQRHLDTNEAFLQKEKQETSQLQLKRLSNSTSKIKSQKNGFSASATKRSSSSCTLGPNSKISNNARSQNQILSNSSSYTCAMDEIDSKSDIKPSLPISLTHTTSAPVSVKSEMIEFDKFNGFQEINNEDLNFYLNDHSKDQGFIGSMDELLDTACNDQDLLMDPEFLESFFDELVDQDQSYQTVRPLLSYSQVSTRQQHQLNSNLHFQNNQARSQSSVGPHSINQAMPISAQMSNTSQITSQSSPAASKKLQQLAEQAQAKHNWTPNNVGNMSIMSNNIVPSHNQFISSPNIINQPQMISQSCLMQNSMISSNQQCYNNNPIMNINMNNHHSNRNDEQSNFWPQQRKDMPLNSSHPKLNPMMISHQENHCKSNHSNPTLQPLHTQPMNRPLPTQMQIQPQMNSQPNDQYRHYWSHPQPQPNQIQHDYNQTHHHHHHHLPHRHHAQPQPQQVILSHNQHYYNNFDNF